MFHQEKSGNPASDKDRINPICVVRRENHFSCKWTFMHTYESHFMHAHMCICAYPNQEFGNKLSFYDFSENVVSIGAVKQLILFMTNKAKLLFLKEISA
jgi:hypothetical protein